MALTLPPASVAGGGLPLLQCADVFVSAGLRGHINKIKMVDDQLTTPAGSHTHKQ